MKSQLVVQIRVLQTNKKMYKVLKQKLYNHTLIKCRKNSLTVFNSCIKYSIEYVVRSTYKCMRNTK